MVPSGELKISAAGYVVHDGAQYLLIGLLEVFRGCVIGGKMVRANVITVLLDGH